jgi:2-aminophenol/2-amino-5-chlorophenol 1,6-dioxygenase alpha subunit
MAVVAAFLVPGSPLPLLRPDVLPWGRLATGYERAGRALAAAHPDVVLMYSTQWLAVLDQLWQTRPRLTGSHVDENWYEFGDLDYDIQVDTALTQACIGATAGIGVRSRPVDYDGFPLDTGTIVATRFLLRDRPVKVVLASNNLYHSAQTTEALGGLAAACAAQQGKRVAVVGVGNLSGSVFREEIDLAADRIFNAEDDRWNRRMLDSIERGDVATLVREAPEFARAARADMGFKHFHWILGALQRRFHGARVHAYGPVYGNGAAVVEFKL